MIQVGNSDISDSVKFKVADAGVCIIDDGVEIRDFVVIECGDGGYIHIKSGTVINSHTWINASGKVTIGKDVLIGPNVSITSTSRPMPDPRAASSWIPRPGIWRSFAKILRYADKSNATLIQMPTSLALCHHGMKLALPTFKTDSWSRSANAPDQTPLTDR